MGQFSWLYCDTKNKKQMLDNVLKDSYLLIPEEFGGGHIVEHCYNGYGSMGGNDIYEVVADWNRKYLTKDCNYCWNNRSSLIDFIDGKSDKFMKEKYGEDWKRDIGIGIACYDEDNASLKYPIKIAVKSSSIYEKMPASLSDPNQGWKY